MDSNSYSLNYTNELLINYKKYFELLKNIEEDFKKENKNYTKLISFDQKYILFTNWLKDNGAIYEKNLNYPVSFSNLNIVGVQAIKEFNDNEALFFIPKKMIIDSCDIKDNPKIKEIIKKIPDFDNQNVLTISIFLIIESFNKNSFWKPYIDLINADAPILWDIKLIEQLDDENMIAEIYEHLNTLTEYYNLLLKNKIFSQEELSLNQFYIFYTFVQSRNFCTNDNQILMVPFADCLNHYHVDVKYECFDSLNLVCKFTIEFDDSIVGKKLKKTNLESFYEFNTDKPIMDDYNICHYVRPETDQENLKFLPNDYFIISTGIKQKFEKNSQVYNFYGQYCNEYLVKWYGFCYLNNKYDFTSLTIHVPKNEDILFDKVIEVFFKDNLMSNYYNTGPQFNKLCFKLKNKKINLKLLNYVRFFYYYENDEIENFVNYKFDLLVEFEILSRSLGLLELSFKKKCEKHEFLDDVVALNSLYFSINNIDKQDLNLISRNINVLIFRATQKLNVLENIKLVKIILRILEDSYVQFDKNSNNISELIKSNYSNIFNDLEYPQDYLINRKKIKKYFNNFKLF